MSMTEAIFQAAYQTKEAWTELIIYTVFFTSLFAYIDYKVEQDIKNYSDE